MDKFFALFNATLPIVVGVAIVTIGAATLASGVKFSCSLAAVTADRFWALFKFGVLRLMDVEPDLSCPSVSGATSVAKIIENKACISNGRSPEFFKAAD
uniref:Uncharacterized protein n=1 Tax=Romanomermis culicivorax TaxID=13658 RepID=A0A915K7Z2_ROMCU